jgi:hypothetical protein
MLAAPPSRDNGSGATDGRVHHGCDSVGQKLRRGEPRPVACREALAACERGRPIVSIWLVGFRFVRSSARKMSCPRARSTIYLFMVLAAVFAYCAFTPRPLGEARTSRSLYAACSGSSLRPNPNSGYEMVSATSTAFPNEDDSPTSRSFGAAEAPNRSFEGHPQLLQNVRYFA